MLNGIPLPGDFKPDALTKEDPIKDRYQLGARVVGAVSCAWIAQWIDATASGHKAAAREALDAMNTSAQWPILQEMNRSGAYGEAVQRFVDAMNNGGNDLQSDESNSNYKNALGCPG